ncbi:hypothetical protein PVK06_045439 [Gossypium arboreum]|uniref:RNase H type-1 domain-containing protein n=1 Tax=Gossypium arboreum TaxID=29729 RepID=A0ABR0MUJ6_GOSAR|nr:hypothetical protein PVK06_045439 [Gossypium arboreum]
MNNDGAFSCTSGAAIGVVMRNDRAELIAGVAKKIDVDSAEEAEAIAVMGGGGKWAVKEQMNKMGVEVTALVFRCPLDIVTAPKSDETPKPVPGMNGAVEIPRSESVTVFEFGSVAATADKVTLAGFCPVSDKLEPCRWEILSAKGSDAPQFRVVF